MVSHHGQLSQPSSVGLKTVFGESPTGSRGAMEPSSSGGKGTTPRLGRTVGSKGNLGEQRRGPFFARALLSHVSVILLLRHPPVRQALLPQPTSTSRPATCKSSMAAIGFLVVSCSLTLLPEAMDTLLAGAATKSIQCTGSTSPQEGHRVAHHSGLDIDSVLQTSLSCASRHLPLLVVEIVRSKASKDATVINPNRKCVQLAPSLDTRVATTVRFDAADASCFVDVAKLEAQFRAYAATGQHLLVQNVRRRCIAPDNKHHLSGLENVAGGLSAVHNILMSRLQLSARDAMSLGRVLPGVRERAVEDQPPGLWKLFSRCPKQLEPDVPTS